MLIPYMRKFPEAIPPEHRDPKSAGYDLFTPYPLTIEPSEQVTVDTGIVLIMDPEADKPYYANVVSTSSVSTVLKLVVDTGVIDANYRGSIGVVLRNVGSKTIHLETGQKIAQVLFILHQLPQLVETNTCDTNTERGTRAFGKDSDEWSRRKAEIIDLTLDE